MSDNNQSTDPKTLPIKDKPEITNPPEPLMKTEPVADEKRNKNIKENEEPENIPAIGFNQTETKSPLNQHPKTDAPGEPATTDSFTISGSIPSSGTIQSTPKPSADSTNPYPISPVTKNDHNLESVPVSDFRPVAENVTPQASGIDTPASPPSKKSGKKMAGLLIGLLFILLTIPAAVFLAQRNQDIRQRAANGELCTANGGQCVDPNLYECASYSTPLNDCAGAPTIKCGFNCHKKGTNPSPSPTPKPTPTPIPGNECRSIVPGADCVPANWSCQEEFGRVDCKRNPLEKCGYKCTGPTPPPPPNDCTTNGGTCYPTNYSCTGNPLPYECYSDQICYQTGACTPPPVCNYGTRGYTRDINAYIQVTQCDVNKCNNLAGGDGIVYVTHYTCPNVKDPAGGCQLNGKNVNFTLNTPIYFDKSLQCGTQQIDIGCKDTIGTYGSLGFLSTLQWNENICQVPPTPKPTPTPQPTPTPPPVGAMCVAIKIYQVNGDIGDAANWQLLTAEQLAALQPGDIIYVTTLGSVQNGIVDKARIRVNSNIWTAENETVLKKPQSEEFYIVYNIPNDGTTTFNFAAEIHEVNTNKWY